jgi:hypothetical protein
MRLRVGCPDRLHLVSAQWHEAGRPLDGTLADQRSRFSGRPGAVQGLLSSDAHNLTARPAVWQSD